MPLAMPSSQDVFRSNAVYEPAGVEEPARIELVFNLAHEPPIAASAPPDGQRGLPRRRAPWDDDVARLRPTVQLLQHGASVFERQVGLHVTDHDAIAGMRL